MRARTILGAAAIMAALAAPASAAQAPRNAERPDLDTRAHDRATVPDSTKSARTGLARALGAGGGVDVDPRLGAVRTLGRTDGLLTRGAAGDAAAVALDYVRGQAQVLGLDAADISALRLAARYASPDGVTHLTWQQMSRGVPSFDGLLTVNVARGGRIVNVTGAAVHDLDVGSSVPAISASKALGVARQDVGGQLTPPPLARTQSGAQRLTTFAGGDSARLVAFADAGGDRLAWRLTVTGEAPYVYDEVVDARTGGVLARHGLTEFVSNAAVYDYHPGTATPAHTVDLAADPTWLNRSTLTSPAKLDGRNAHAYADVGAPNGFNAGEDVAPSSAANWTYPQVSVPCATGTASIFSSICTWNIANRAGSEPANRAQTTTQLFYYVNTFHDWLTQAPVGFTNASHNFEIGGTGGSDQLNAEADDSSGTNNANMTTPADGASPRMQMYLFTPLAVNSGDDASVVYHEYTHGLSNRLVNNGLGGALTTGQPQAMGEGWSDWYALDYLVQKGFVTDTAADGEVREGEYATNDVNTGIRYNAIDCSVGSANATKCPGTPTAGSGGFTFADMGRVGTYGNVAGDEFTSFEVHDDGEIWSETLWDLRKAIGGADARGLIANAMRLSPANPSFLDMRDTILQADQVAGGTWHNQIWHVFANRAMGFSASTSSSDATRGTAATDLPPATAGFARMSSPAITDPAPLGDGDGRPEPGETVRLKIALSNPGASALTTVRADLSTTTSGVVVGQPSATYPAVGARPTDASSSDPFAITLPAALACGTSVALNLRVRSDQGDVTQPIVLQLGTKTGTTYSYSGPSVAIPDASIPGASVTLNVPDIGTIETARVTFATNHTFTGDLAGRLTSPDGTFVELFERPGGGEFGTGISGWNVIFDDSAAQAIQDLPAWTGGAQGSISGSYRPNEALAKLSGHPQNGTWKLRVYDVASPDTGAITAFKVELPHGSPTCSTTAPAPPTATTDPATSVGSTTATLNGTLNPTTASTDYVFEYGPTTAYGQTAGAGTAAAGSGSAAHAASVTGLAGGTTFHYRLVARRAGTVVALGDDVTFTTTTVAAAATTDPATAVGATGATLNATINPNGSATTYKYEYGTTTAFGTVIGPFSAGAGSAAVSQPGQSITGLAPNTTYYYRVAAKNAAPGETFGAVTAFTTTGAAAAPSAVTGGTTSVTGAGATLTGTVNAHGQATAYTFEYGTSTSFGAITPVQNAGSTSADLAVSAALGGLDPNTTYYVRLVATNASGTTTGPVAAFTTTGAAAAPVVATGAATAVTISGATLSGTVNPKGSPTSFVFEYGTTTSFGSISAVDSAGSSGSTLSVSLPIESLNPATTYVYRLVASNAAGTSFGAVASFTTPVALAAGR